MELRMKPMNQAKILKRQMFPVKKTNIKISGLEYEEANVIV
jgi:hypothetical protein